MKLIHFTVRNYRSITKAYKLPLHQYVVLVGPNNEGKSNVLRALVLALRLLTEGRWAAPGRARSRRPRFSYRLRQDDFVTFDWIRDYPIQLQPDEPNGASDFILEFALAEDERAALNEHAKINLNTNLKIKLSIDPHGVRPEVLLQGRAKKQVTAQFPAIAEYVSSRVVVAYIPSIRTSEMAVKIIAEMITRELETLDAQPQYAALLQQLADVRQPVLDAIAAEVTGTISSFLPDVKKVQLHLRHDVAGGFEYGPRVSLDDGNMTDLDLKGDGIKSLIAIALMRHTAQASLSGQNLILAIEEPESHLHPKSIHRLRQVLQDIATTQQVVVSTHSQELVERQAINHNIVVRNNKAVPANRIADVRDALGVRLSDNLATAFAVLLLEGEEDRIVIPPWLCELSPVLQRRIASGDLAVDCLRGATNLRYKVALYKTCLCNVFAVLDNDASGRASLQEALDEGLLDPAEYALATHRGMSESECEDLIDLGTYKLEIERQFAIVLAEKLFKNNKKKWSDRVRDCFTASGKNWDSETELRVKTVVAQLAAKAGCASIKPTSRPVLEAIARAVERFFTSAQERDF